MSEGQVAQSETIEQIAERIAKEHVVGGFMLKTALKRCADDVLSALHNERERCAKVAETRFVEGDTGWRCGKEIASAIREGR